MRIRTVKPEFWTSEDVAALDWDTRLLFIGLWSYVDDNGVGRDVERLILADLFPLEEDPREALAKVSRGLRVLSETGLIERYTADGKPYLHVSTWDLHQRIDRPAKPRYPLPTSGNADPREPLATPSREVRDGVDAGTEEQRSRGAEEHVTPDGATDIAAKRKTLDDHWAEFWALYPRKVGKVDARTAWDKARKQATIPEILDGLRRWVDDPTRDPDMKITPHPSTWLNRGQWTDEPGTGGYSPDAAPVPSKAAPRDASGQLTPEAVDAILGREPWDLPPPPDDIEPGTRTYIEWARTTTLAHYAERRALAEAKLRERTAS